MEQINEKVSELLALEALKPTTTQILWSLLVTLMLACILWGTYKLANTPKTYRPQFAATLVSLAIISTVLMDLIQSNLALSLGMLGSLSIVRFRTTIHDPRDIGFIFWSMAIGLSAATGCWLLGFVGSIVMAVFMIVSAKRQNISEEMMLVVRGSCANLGNIGAIIDTKCQNNKVKAKNVLSDSFELVYEVTMPTEESDNLIGMLFTLEGIDSVNLLVENNAR